MKHRIVENLRAFSESNAVDSPPAMLIQISNETGLTEVQLHERAKNTLKHLIHHYAGFSVETIDSFNHRLIRTFARDLKLASNFEVSLEEGQLLSEAVDNLVSKAGINEKITQVLIDFALSKTDEDKSWDISRDIASAAKILFSENDNAQVENLKKKTLDDFIQYTIKIKNAKHEYSTQLVAIASEVLRLIEESGLQAEDFSNKSLPAYFGNLKSGNSVNFNLKWQESLGEKPLYPGRVLKDSPHVAETIDELTPRFIDAFETTKALYFKKALYASILKNLIPLSVINLVNEELEAIKNDRNLFPISQFNSLINNEIRNQPAPFIYERLGEKYQHFFIDEFQDTSLLQWKNLIPLIDNALSQSNLDEQSASLLLVGDAKQSIYRWRGGLPEQFIGLYNKDNPFSIREKKVENLQTNWRSCKEIITFNNEFFTHIAENFGNSVHQQLYKIGNQQQCNEKKDGFVKILFNEAENKAEEHEIYAQQVFETIQSLRKQQYALNEICILTRKKADGIELSSYLLERDIPIVSSETLLLQYSPAVKFLLNTLSLSLFFDHNEHKIEFLDFIITHLNSTEDTHAVYKRFLGFSSEEFSEAITSFGIDFNFQQLHSLSLYESLEIIILSFKLAEKADAYLDAFMNLAFDFEQQPQSGKQLFLEYWETVKDVSAVPINESVDAVRLMTIHKAKGLEFPVVLFPFADVNIYKEMDSKSWYPVDDPAAQFTEVLIDYKNEVENYGAAGREIHEKRRQRLELDNYNLLYVTLTRPIEQLYIFSKKVKQNSANEITNYNSLFIDFLKHKNMWEDEKMDYEFGVSRRTMLSKEIRNVEQILPEYPLSKPSDHNLEIVSAEASYWQTETETAIYTGNILHDSMAEITHKDDIVPFFEALELDPLLSKEEQTDLKDSMTRIVMHPQLCEYFLDYEWVANERDIITRDGVIQRPDRLNFNRDGSVTIIDYKTGEMSEHHEVQIRGYAAAIQDMGYSVKEMLIIYSVGGDILINKI